MMRWFGGSFRRASLVVAGLLVGSTAFATPGGGIPSQATNRARGGNGQMGTALVVQRTPEIANQRAAAALELPVEFVAQAAAGLELIYGRDYRGARAHFAAMDEAHPGMALGNLGKVLIFQALMLENFDYRFEGQYQTYTKRALDEIEAALEQPGNTRWELFIRGGVLGLEAIHLMRQSEFVASMSKGVEALNSLKRLEELAPDFVDLRLGDGLYKYWRSAVARKTPLIPDGPDERAAGLEIITTVEREAAFVGPAATLGLAAIRMEERRWRGALRHIRGYASAYPNSVINRQLEGRMLLRLRRYNQALEAFDRVQQLDDDNHRVHLYRAIVYLRKGELEQAHTSIDQYLALPLDELAQAEGHHKKGDIFFRARDYPQARREYNLAIGINNFAASRRMLRRVDAIEASASSTGQGGGSAAAGAASQ